MIKLIATDMDGTLLDGEGNLPKDFIETFYELKNKGIKFIAASGRPYYTLYQNFDPVSDDITYIADNGAMVVENGKITSYEKMEEKVIKEVLEACEKVDNITVILCGLKRAYHKPCSKEALNEINKYYIKKNVIKDYSEIDDIIFKISILDLGKAKYNSFPIFKEKFDQSLSVVISGEVWVDFTNKGIDKGNALKLFREKHDIAFEETMAFGDFFNDVGMLKNAYYSFVMENASDEMKKYGRFIAKKNTENGVIEEIKKYI